MSTFFKLKTSNDNKSNLNISKSDTITLDLLGFTIDQQDGRHIIKWTDIERLQAYKVDLLTTDDVHLNIWHHNKIVRITTNNIGTALCY